MAKTLKPERFIKNARYGIKFYSYGDKEILVITTSSTEHLELRRATVTNVTKLYFPHGLDGQCFVSTWGSNRPKISSHLRPIDSETANLLVGVLP